MGGCPKVDSALVQDRAISVTEAASRFRDKSGHYLFIDARVEAEHAARRIPGSRRMDPWDVDPKDPDPAFDNYKELIVYGQNPGAARAEALVKRFYHAKQNHARLMTDGLDEWISRGNPTEGAAAGGDSRAPSNP